MRHRVAGRRLGRTSEHRLALRRNMVASLFEHETIATTIQKAKEVKPFAEKLITLAKRGLNKDAAGQVHARRIAASRLYGKPVVSKLFDEIAPLYQDRAGGFTRMVKLGRRRGDNAEMALLELVQD